MLYQNIKKRADERGESLRSIERGARLKPCTIHKWNTTDPGVEKVKAVADYLGTTIDELMKE